MVSVVGSGSSRSRGLRSRLEGRGRDCAGMLVVRIWAPVSVGGEEGFSGAWGHFPRTPQENQAGFRRRRVESPAMGQERRQATEARAPGELRDAASKPLGARPSSPRGNLLPGKGWAGGAGGGLSCSLCAPRPLTSDTLRARPSLALDLEKHTRVHTPTAPRSPGRGTAARAPLGLLPGAEARPREEEEQANMAARRAGPAGRA